MTKPHRKLKKKKLWKKTWTLHALLKVKIYKRLYMHTVKFHY